MRHGRSAVTGPAGRVLLPGATRAADLDRKGPDMTTHTVQHDLRPVEAARPQATRWLGIAAGAALVAAPLLWAAGMWTSPPASGTTDLDYVTALGRDGTITQVSALFLHYGNLFIGLGVLAAASLLRGSRGSVLTVVGAVLTSLGFTNLSGMLLSDWWNLAAVRVVGADKAAKVFDSFQGSSLLFPWNGFEVFSLVGSLLLLAGLARAGVLGWWTLGVLVGGVVGLMFVPWDLPHLSALAVLVGFSPFAMVGVRLLQRARLQGA